MLPMYSPPPRYSSIESRPGKHQLCDRMPATPSPRPGFRFQLFHLNTFDFFRHHLNQHLNFINVIPNTNRSSPWLSTTRHNTLDRGKGKGKGKATNVDEDITMGEDEDEEEDEEEADDVG